MIDDQFGIDKGLIFSMYRLVAEETMNQVPKYKKKHPRVISHVEI